MSISEFLNTYYSSGALDWQEEFYQWMHANPELSGYEEETAAAIARKLAGFDCAVTTGIGGHGMVAVFSNGPGPAVLMRADFDGLPVKETTGVPFASVKVQNGKPTMHACGHDMHTTSLLGACAILDANRDQWSGTFIALFQPAEETTAGALAMVEDDLAGVIPRPDYCFGQHIVPGPAGAVMSMPGAALAACDTITITLHGKSAHGSMPHKSIDPTYLAAMIVVRLQGIVGREVDPFNFAVVTVGTLQSGDTNNTVPSTAKLVLNCRFYDDEVKASVYEAIERVVRAECLASNCPKEPEFVYSAHGELTDNDGDVFNTVRPVFDSVFGADSIDASPWTASEDFPTIPNHFGAPYLFWTVGITPRDQWDSGEEVPGNHMGTFLPDYAPTMRACTLAGAAAVLTYLGK
ncbi:MAG: amidohydrolase [Corynebacterium sp.]|nr:amidohydrolase [Corynebacterium sp.]